MSLALRGCAVVASVHSMRSVLRLPTTALRQLPTTAPVVSALQLRCQSTTPGDISSAKVDEKKFHCSICKKAFRLEMAAAVHVKQAHGGGGEVLQGSGPGVPEPTSAVPTPTPAQPVQPLSPVSSPDVQAHRTHRVRPVAQPLNKPAFEVPKEALDELMQNWDDVGSAKVPNFVHSSVVMKVFAATQPDASASGASLFPGNAPEAEGDNPFAALAKDSNSAKESDSAKSKAKPSSVENKPEPGVSSAPNSLSSHAATTAESGKPVTASSSSVPAKSTQESAGSISKSDVMPPYAIATTDDGGPFSPPAVKNPFSVVVHATPIKKKAAPAPHVLPIQSKSALPNAAAPPLPNIQAAPITTPIAPQNILAKEPSAAAGQASSPFAAASQAPSPFAAAGQAPSPFAAAGQAPSPFAAAGQAPSPFAVAGQAPSPFAAAGQAPSPFAAAGQAPSPFAAAGQAPSPFAAAGQAPSPFAAAGQAPSPFAAAGQAPSPFAAAGQAPSPFAAAGQAPSPFAAAGQAPSPFAMAGQAPSPFAAAGQAPSPFAAAGQAPSPFAAAGQAPSPFAAAGQAPSPFAAAGQAPSPFAAAGQAPSPFAAAGQAPSPFAAAGQAPSPFAAAGQAPSPFAAAGQAPSPFAAAGQAPSPFAAAGQAPSPFAAAGQAPSPFAAAGQAPSPFAAAGQAPSPFAAAGQAPSPFAAAGQASSPFAAAGQAPLSFVSASQFSQMAGALPKGAFAGVSAPPLQSFAGAGSMQFGAAYTGGAGSFEEMKKQGKEILPGDDKQFTCSHCGKGFKSEMGLSTHCSSKHGVTITLSSRKDSKSKRAEQQLPDLPPYVPSPVDLSATSPFGSHKQRGSAVPWESVALAPHGRSISNITVVGDVVDVQTGYVWETPVVQLSVHVKESESTSEETLVVRCFGAGLTGRLKEAALLNSVVVVNGTVRLNPFYEPSTNRYYCNPVVHVSEPLGAIQVLPSA